MQDCAIFRIFVKRELLIIRHDAKNYSYIIFRPV